MNRNGESFRIVSLLPSATEILFLLGCGERVVGVSHECNYPAEACALPRVTSSALESGQSSAEIDAVVSQSVASAEALYRVNANRIAELAPDLIVTQSQCDVCAVKLDDVRAALETLPALRTSRLATLAPETLDEVLDDIRGLAQVIGLPVAAAESAIGGLNERMARVRQNCANPPFRPRTLLIEWFEPLMVAGNWNPELIETAGGAYGLGEQGRHSDYHEWQEVLAFDPQVLILSPCGFNLDRGLREVGLVTSRPGFRSLSAVRDGKVFLVDGDAYFNRSGPRLVDSMEIAAHLIHPSVFPNLYPNAWRRLAE